MALVLHSWHGCGMGVVVQVGAALAAAVAARQSIAEPLATQVNTLLKKLSA